MFDPPGLRTASPLPPEPRWEWRTYVFFLGIVLLTVLHAGILAYHLPVFQRFFPDWFGVFARKPADNPWAIGSLLFLTPLLLATVFHFRKHPGVSLIPLLLLGYILQISLGYLENRGIDGIRDRMKTTGHAEFAEVAVGIPSILPVLRHYEEDLRRGDLGDYAKSKPPGQLLIYYATFRLGTWLSGATTKEEKLHHTRTFAAFTWPFVCCFAVLPLFLLGTELFDGKTALGACLLYLFVPAVHLMTLHTDQAFFPLLALGSLVFSARAISRRSPAWAIGGGIWTYLAFFCSFGLLGIIPFIILLFAAAPGPGKEKITWQRRLLPAVLFVAGFGITHALFRVSFGYDFSLRYREAMAFHEAWQKWHPHFGLLIHYSLMNFVEFSLWLGIPIAGFTFARSYWSLRSFPQRPVPFANLLAIVFSLTIFLLLAFGRSKGEVARLWLFLMPIACLITAEAVQRKFPGKTLMWGAILFLQGMTLLLTKIHQDFW
jgi:hypothetical protein